MDDGPPFAESYVLWRQETDWTDEQHEAFSKLNERIRELIDQSGLPRGIATLGVGLAILAAFEATAGGAATHDAEPTVQ